MTLGLQAVYDLPHRHGFSSLMPRPQHKDADEELQAIFKEVILDQIQAIRDDHPWQEVRVWFDDEALEEAAMAAWRAACLGPELVRSICAAPYVSACE